LLSIYEGNRRRLTDAGIGFGPDPIEYNTHTHHTNLDSFERVIEDA